MLKKSCAPSHELQCLRVLHRRMNLSPGQRQYYLSLEKGFEGEQTLNQSLLQLEHDTIIMNDLLIEHHHSFCQIDTLVLTYDQAYLFEVKHYEGEYYLNKNRLYLMNGKEMKDPLLQLQRSEAFLRQTFQTLPLTLPIQGLVAYTHPFFTLYHASSELPVLLPNQLQRFIQKWNQEPSSPLTKQHHHAAEQLLRLHWDLSPYTRLPDYNYPYLIKGVSCPSCSGWMKERKNTLICASCGNKETRRSGIQRSIEEFRLLFPKNKLTTPIIYDWCGLSSSRKNVSRVLLSHYQRVGKGKGSYYVSPPHR
ncbi:nuclease-related domain-containing protein [Salibacterium sp. K-3]